VHGMLYPAACTPEQRKGVSYGNRESEVFEYRG
jgi:hypothetical protein